MIIEKTKKIIKNLLIFNFSYLKYALAHHKNQSIDYKIAQRIGEKNNKKIRLYIFRYI